MSITTRRGPAAYTRLPLRDDDGVPSFVEEENFYKKVEWQTMLTVISLAKTAGWRTALTGIRNDVVKKAIGDPIKTMFLELVRISPGERVLDLGAGWGSLSMQIAKRYSDVEVYAFDKASEGLLFLNVVKGQEKLANLHIARVDTMDIPMADSSFDVAFIIRALESIGESVKNISPLEAQLKLLHEVRRLLRDGGRAVIGVENRFSYKYLTGRHASEHTAVIHSQSGYRNLFLKGAGFKKVETFVASPNCRFPRAISDPSSVRKMMIASHKEKDLKWIRIFPDSFLRMVVPSFYFIVEK
jgi:ubiquinone/menaquinone biosynthesis C-methylase UbiE